MNNPNFRTPTMSVNDWRADNFNENLLHGVIDWCVWSMLDLGAYHNVYTTGGGGIYGGNMSRLRPVTDPNYANGRVWEAIRSDWVWESGITYTGTPPIISSGVNVTGVFYPTSSTSGIYEHIVNFPLGRIIFTHSVSTGLIISTDYCYKEVTFVESNEPWFRELLYNSHKINRAEFLAAVDSGGPFERLGQTRCQMPAVGVEIVNRRGYTPYEIGSLRQIINQDVLFYVLAENPTDRNQLLDILGNQSDKTIRLIDRTIMKSASGYPFGLDYNGSPVDSPVYYPELISRFGTITANISNVTSSTFDNINSWLSRGVVRATFNSII
jgi:hypothetical protein